jgi:hypothetical protein
LFFLFVLLHWKIAQQYFVFLNEYIRAD